MINPAIKRFFLDLFFPKFCVGCQKEGVWLCADCAHKIVLVKSQVCPDCGRLSLNGRYCRKCQKNYVLTGVIGAAYFKEGPIQEIIHNFKYNSVVELSSGLGEILNQALKDNLPTGDLMITFIPLHSKRLAQRGYNQSEILASYVAEKLDLPISDLLIKKKKTKRQVELNMKERRKNLANMFALRYNYGTSVPKKGAAQRALPGGRTIILVDDVTTTGATLNEGAKVLKKAGAKAVWGLVVARG